MFLSVLICVGLWPVFRVGLWPVVRVGLWLIPGFFLSGAAGRVLGQLARAARVAVGARGGERQLPWHVLLPEERVAEDVVVHVAALGDEARVLDVADDLH